MEDTANIPSTTNETQPQATVVQDTKVNQEVNQATSLNYDIARIVKTKLRELEPEAKEDKPVKPVYSDKEEEVETTTVKKEPAEKKEVKTTEESEKPIKAPVSWSKEEKANFEKLPPELKTAIYKRETERDVYLQNTGREVSRLKKELEEVKPAQETISYIEENAKKIGAPNAKALIERVLEISELSKNNPVEFLARVTDQNPLGYIKALMSRYDIDVRQLASGRDDLAFDNYTHSQVLQNKQMQDQIDALNRQIEEEKQEKIRIQQEIQQQQQESEITQVEKEMQRFYSKKDEYETESAIPYLSHAIKVVVAEAQNAGEQINDYQVLLERAHKKALRLNDNYSPRPQHQEYDVARSRSVSPSSRGSVQGVVKEDFSGKNFNDTIASIVRSKLRQFG